MARRLLNLEGALRDVVYAVEAAWRSVVMGSERLPGVPEIQLGPYWQQLYLNNIRRGDDVNVPEAGFLRSQVVCTNRISTDVEYGRAPWDMKPMLLGGKAHRVSKKGGRYTIIPLRHGVPGTQLFKAMPQAIYERAKELIGSHSGAGPMKAFRESTTAGGGRGHGRLLGYRKGVAWGESLRGTGAPQVHEITRNLKTGQALQSPIRYRHKAGIHEGMYRFPQKTARGEQSTYVTFRVVSDNSDPQSWFHPGWAPHGIVDGLVRVMAPKVEAKLEQAARLDLVAVDDLSVGMRITGA